MSLIRITGLPEIQEDKGELLGEKQCKGGLTGEKWGYNLEETLIWTGDGLTLEVLEQVTGGKEEAELAQEILTSIEGVKGGKLAWQVLVFFFLTARTDGHRFLV